jgi:hypothetical protein
MRYPFTFLFAALLMMLLPLRSLKAQEAELIFGQTTPGRFDTLKVHLVLPRPADVECAVIGADTLITTAVHHFSEGISRWEYPLNGLMAGSYYLLFHGEGLHRQWTFTVVTDAP